MKPYSKKFNLYNTSLLGFIENEVSQNQAELHNENH